MSSTSSLAPPCSGPVSVPMAELMTVYGLASVEPVTRPLNVEAFIVCSACRIRQASSTLRDGRRRLLLEEHVVEIGGVVEVVARRDRLVAVAEAMEGGDDGRQLGDQADDRIPVALRVGDVAGRVEHAHGRDAGLQGVHRMAGLGQALDQVVELVLDAAMMAELVVEVGQLASAWAGRP